MLFNVINSLLLKREKNTLADELRDVGHVICTMEKQTARCLGGRSQGSGGSDLEGRALPWSVRQFFSPGLLLPRVFFSYLLSS